jgi:hypothetical protein
MEANPPRRKMSNKNEILYLMLVIAAVSVIILSIFGVATITGLIPTAQSNSVQQQDSRPKTQPQSVPPPAKPARATPIRIAATAYDNCGLVETIKAVEVKGKGTGRGRIAEGCHRRADRQPDRPRQRQWVSS